MCESELIIERQECYHGRKSLEILVRLPGNKHRSKLRSLHGFRILWARDLSACITLRQRAQRTRCEGEWRNGPEVANIRRHAFVRGSGGSFV
jgi:hypothetical protein